MTDRSWQHIRMEQCDAAEGIRVRYGLKAALDYALGEKLLHFAEAAARHRDFAREMPRFVLRVRSMFSSEEITTPLARIKRERREAVVTDVEANELDVEDPATLAERARQFEFVKELLTAPTMGTSSIVLVAAGQVTPSASPSVRSRSATRSPTSNTSMFAAGATTAHQERRKQTESDCTQT